MTEPQAPEADAPVQQVDYFGFEQTEVHYLPDKVTYVELKAMNEGAKKEYQKLTSTSTEFDQGKQTARMKLDPGKERHELIRQSVVGWNLVRGKGPNQVLVPFNERNLADFLRLANPVIIEDIEKAIRKLNPWMLAEMKVEDIEREIANLQEMLEVAKEREAGEDS